MRKRKRKTVFRIDYVKMSNASWGNLLVDLHRKPELGQEKWWNKEVLSSPTRRIFALAAQGRFKL
jgi:hypothetical protein